MRRAATGSVPPPRDRHADEMLDSFGLSWGAMSAQQRQAYGPEYDVAVECAPSLSAVLGLLDLTHTYPKATAWEGPVALCRRMRVPRDVLALAEQLDRYCAATAEQEYEEPVPITSLDEITARRVLAATDRIGYELTDGLESAASALSRAYRDIGLSPAVALYCLQQWNAHNAPPLATETLHTICAEGETAIRGAA